MQKGLFLSKSESYTTNQCKIKKNHKAEAWNDAMLIFIPRRWKKETSRKAVKTKQPKKTKQNLEERT